LPTIILENNKICSKAGQGIFGGIVRNNNAIVTEKSDMSEYRRSLLQSKILLHLKERSPKTITELAEWVGSQRPSVSRSLRKLKEQGLVFRDRKGWHLTGAGEIEANLGQEKMLEIAQSFTASNQRNIEALGRLVSSSFDTNIVAQSFTESSMANIAHNLLGKVQLPPVSNLIGLEAQTAQLANAMSSLSGTLLKTNLFEDAIKPLLDIQEMNNTLLSEIISSQFSWLSETILGQNNLVLSKAMDNILAIRQGELARLTNAVVELPDIQWLAQDIANVNQSFAQLFRGKIKVLSDSLSTLSTQSLANELAVPTVAVGYYSETARYFIDAEDDTSSLSLPEHEYEEIGDQTLDEQLLRLKPEFVEMRNGAWLALCSGNPDRIRQAAVSQRELLTQLLTLLAPTEQLPKENRSGPQIKRRMVIILGASNSDAEFIEALTDAVYNCYNQLNKYTHHSNKYEASLRALLHTVEGLIRFILVQVSNMP